MPGSAPTRSRNASSRRPTGMSDLLEVAVLLKEVGLLDPLRPQRSINIVPLFETIDDLRACGRHHGPAAVAARLSPAGRQPRRRAGSDARLFRQQQGRRLPHLGLGAVQGRDRAGRGVRSATASGCGCSTAAAARSAAAAGRATRPSSRSPAARCTARSASPSRARSSPASIPNAEVGRRNLEILAAATLEASLLQPRAERAARRSICTAMEELSAHAFAAYRGAGLRDRRASSDYFWESTVITEIADAEHRQPPGLAQEDHARSRICARFPGCSAGRSAA